MFSENSDCLKDGDNHVLAIKINSHYAHPGNPFPAKLILSTLSEAYYRYSTTRNLQQSTNGDPFAQPVLVYTNIQNGLGIFGGYNQSVFILKKISKHSFNSKVGSPTKAEDTPKACILKTYYFATQSTKAIFTYT